MEAGFDIRDTWLFMGLVAQYEQAEVTRYIQKKKQIENKTASDIASIEVAGEIRSSLRETCEILVKKSKGEKGGQYSNEALEKLLGMKVISSREFEVMALRAAHTYEEIGARLGIDTSTAFRTVERVHERVKQIYGRLCGSVLAEGLSEEALEKRAEKISERILEAHLSEQQMQIYLLLCKGYSDSEIQLRLKIGSGTYRVQKCRINKQKKFLEMV